MAQDQRVETAVGSLEVRSHGDGPPAVLWHSLFVDERSWDRVRDDLAVDRRLILITGPGHGGSSDPGHRYTMEDCAAAAEAVLDALGVTEPVDWVGNAWGGHVGAIFAATWPARCRTLVTIGTPVQALSRAERARTRFLLLAYRLAGPVGFIQDGVAKVLLSAGTRAHDPAAVSMVKGCLVDADRAALANAIVSISLRRRDLTGFLPKISAPTLFITGADHTGWTPRQAAATARLLPQGSSAVVAGAAYLAPLEVPAEIVRLVRQFWAAHVSRSPAG